MNTSQAPLADGYEDMYRGFDSALMRQVRREAYGEDIGQHSWVGATELREDIQRLQLTPRSRVLDLGCGPCGPLTFVLATLGCTGVGVELSPSALAIGRTKAVALGVDALLNVHQQDLNHPLPFSSHSFDAVMSLDVVLHLLDRLAFFREVARVLSPGHRFLVTDAGILTGPVSSEEVRARSVHGYTQFVPAGTNEAMLAAAGFKVVETANRTASVLANATGRLAAIRAHRAELEQVSSAAGLLEQQTYLETVIELSRRGALSRMMYLAESGAGPAV